MSDKILRAGIIGLGRVGWILEDDPLRGKPCTHAGCWSNHPNVELVTGCDIDNERLLGFGERYGVTKLYADYQDMLAQEAPELVSVSAYATERCEMVLAAIEAGVRGVWCEKVMATSLAESARMKQALQASRVPMIVSYMRRWERRYQLVKQLIDDGRLGKLQTITAHFTGNMLHTGTHAFDILRLFAGEVIGLQAWLRDDQGRSLQSGYRYGRDECFEDFGGNAVLHFDSGVTAFVHGEDRDYFRFEFELLGSQGMVRLGNTQTELWEIGESGYATGLAELQQSEFPVFKRGNSWVTAVDNLVHAVMQGGNVLCGVEDAEASLRIALAMHESHREGNREVDLLSEITDMQVRSR